MKKALLITAALMALLAAGCKKDVQGLKDVDVKTLPAPEYVELAPGIVWATCNMGATAPHEKGDRYMWGELTPNKDDEDYRLLGPDGWPDLLDYTDIEKKPCLLPKDDIVTRTYGKEWRIPTLEDWEILMDVCSWSFVKISGVNCIKGESKVYETEIIFPHSEEEYEPGNYKYGYYWTSTNYDDMFARVFYFLRTSGGNLEREGSVSAKYISYPVRAVKVVK